jgi:hypothetical protein
MRLGRGNRDHPAVVAEATAVAADTADAVKVASEEATRNSHTLSATFVAPEKPAVATGVAVPSGDCPKPPRRNEAATIASTF